MSFGMKLYVIKIIIMKIVIMIIINNVGNDQGYKFNNDLGQTQEKTNGNNTRKKNTHKHTRFVLITNSSYKTGNNV